MSLIQYAVTFSSLRCVETLLVFGADPNVPVSEKSHPLAMASNLVLSKGRGLNDPHQEGTSWPSYYGIIGDATATKVSKSSESSQSCDLKQSHSGDCSDFRDACGKICLLMSYGACLSSQKVLSVSLHSSFHQSFPDNSEGRTDNDTVSSAVPHTFVQEMTRNSKYIEKCSVALDRSVYAMHDPEVARPFVVEVMRQQDWNDKVPIGKSPRSQNAEPRRYTNQEKNNDRRRREDLRPSIVYENPSEEILSSYERGRPVVLPQEYDNYYV
ncbi:hypothetical protein BX600DRAFT_447666 [Xylariales sp. PMI_506]|nr:hypothetical protein BX600DRAFT_447666 [Xylariales sp. PMI_506]